MKIVVIEAWGLHLGYVGCYGNDWTGTPNMDRLAAEGVVFEWHYADQPELTGSTPWAQRSVATGRYAILGDQAAALPQAQAVPHVVRCEALADFSAQALDAVLGPHDWVWVEGPSLLPPWNLHEELLEAYFDEDDRAEGLMPWQHPPLAAAQLSEAEVLELQNTYAAAVTFFDAQLGEVIDPLRDKRMLDDILLCVTARSGLPLGEHGMIGTPKPWLHDELVHVPLLMRLPGAAEAGLRIGALTQPIDLLPTFLEYAGHKAILTQGHSLWPLLRGEVEEVRPHVIAALRGDGCESWMLRTRDWVLQVPRPTAENPQPGSPRLYAKPEDRWEVNDLSQQQMERVDQMEATLRVLAAAERSGE